MSCAVCEHVFVLDDDSAQAHFRHALRTRNLQIIRTAAADMPVVRLDDALQVCVLLRDREPERYERAAVRWIGRYCVEHPEATLDDVEQARAAFAIMREDAPEALTILQTLCRLRRR